MKARAPSTDELIAGVRSGHRTALAQAITLVESNRVEDHGSAQELLRQLLPATGSSLRIGISGVPGVGKSTFIETFGSMLLDNGHRVAVLAVDPSSSLTGGSILGDKTRMGELALDDRAFIRPSPSGGSLGGVGRKTRESVLICEAAGYDLILVETVGVGQSETLVAEMVDVLLLLKLAGAGDELQGIKRGILEHADLIAINKADGDNRDRAETARVDFERALAILRPPRDDGWSPRVVTCSAVEGRGVDTIWRLIAEQRDLHQASGAFVEKRNRQLIHWMWSLVDEGLHLALRQTPEVSSAVSRLEDEVLGGRLTPTAAAREILATFRRQSSPC